MKQRYQFLLACVVALTVLATGGTQAQAPFTIIFAPNTQTANPGDLLYYSATFTNTSATNYFFTGASFNSTSPNADLLQGFFNGDPVNGDPNTGAFEVLGNSSKTISDVFALQLDPAQPGGTYQGFVTFTGQTAADYPNGTDVELGSGNIALKVSASAPEPSQWAGLGFAAFGAMGLLWKTRRRSAQSSG